jgi:uncharacterized OB-fold protein
MASPDCEADDLVAPFWDAFTREEIVLPRCSSCQRVQWYPDSTGPDCPGAIFEWISVPTTGTVYSLTRVHRRFLPDGEPVLPFVVGFVELDGVDGARLVARFDDDDRLRIGARVAARFVHASGRDQPVFHVGTG